MNEEWLEVLKILILYKFGEKGTAESTADEICNIFIGNDEK